MALALTGRLVFQQPTSPAGLGGANEAAPADRAVIGGAAVIVLFLPRHERLSAHAFGGHGSLEAHVVPLT